MRSRNRIRKLGNPETCTVVYTMSCLYQKQLPPKELLTSDLIIDFYFPRKTDKKYPVEFNQKIRK
jgi:hypothetical protein